MLIFLLTATAIYAHSIDAMEGAGTKTIEIIGSTSNASFIPVSSYTNPQARDLSKHPVYLTYDITDSESRTYVRLYLNENSNGTLVKFPTYFISIADTNNPSSSILNDLFQSPSGVLVLLITHDTGSTNNATTTIYANQEPIANAWVPDPDGIIHIRHFPFTSGKTYLMNVTIFAMDMPRSIFNPNEEPSLSFTFTSDNNSLGKVLVVPEFGSLGLLAITSGVIGMVVMAGRMMRFRHWKN